MNYREGNTVLEKAFIKRIRKYFDMSGWSDWSNSFFMNVYHTKCVVAILKNS